MQTILNSMITFNDFKSTVIMKTPLVSMCFLSSIICFSNLNIWMETLARETCMANFLAHIQQKISELHSKYWKNSAFTQQLAQHQQLTQNQNTKCYICQGALLGSTDKHFNYVYKYVTNLEEFLDYLKPPTRLNRTINLKKRILFIFLKRRQVCKG
ncbi:uncharacterized protein ACN427_013975 [Glossina fuscipes fuscipes]